LDGGIKARRYACLVTLVAASVLLIGCGHHVSNKPLAPSAHRTVDDHSVSADVTVNHTKFTVSIAAEPIYDFSANKASNTYFGLSLRKYACARFLIDNEDGADANTDYPYSCFRWYTVSGKPIAPAYCFIDRTKGRKFTVKKGMWVGMWVFFPLRGDPPILSNSVAKFSYTPDRGRANTTYILRIGP